MELLSFAGPAIGTFMRFQFLELFFNIQVCDAAWKLVLILPLHLHQSSFEPLRKHRQ